MMVNCQGPVVILCFDILRGCSLSVLKTEDGSDLDSLQTDYVGFTY